MDGVTVRGAGVLCAFTQGRLLSDEPQTGRDEAQAAHRVRLSCDQSARPSARRRA